MSYKTILDIRADTKLYSTMAQEDDLRALGKVMDFMRGISVIFLLTNCYWFCYEAFQEWHFTLGIVNKILMNFQHTAGLFSSILWTKLFCVVFLALSCLGTKGVKEEKITWPKIWTVLFSGFVFFFFNWWLLALPIGKVGAATLYIFTLSVGYICLLMGGVWMSRLLKNNLMDDVFNTENESFMQETRLMENEYSVNLPTRFYYKKKWNKGWINVVNPFRASMVLGTPGSGKSYAIVNNYIKQQIEKGFAMYIYDYKFPDLSEIAYNHLLHHLDAYKVTPQFFVINFDDPRKSHRCNPINPAFMTDISDAYESAYTIMLNLNRSWIQKQGDFFVESPIILLAAIIWFLKIYENGKYCTFPHAIEFLNRPYAQIFPILTSYDELANYLSPFMDAWEGGAQDQLQGQIASAKIPLSRMISPALYWVMTGDDFSLDINNPNEPKVLVVGNNPDRQNIYSAALGLYNSRIVKLINKKKQLKVVGETAKTLSERFGKVLQQRQSMTINRNDKSTSISTQMDSLIPASKISNLTQGMFVGAMSDNFDERIDQKIFHAEIVVDSVKVSAEMKAYQSIPVIADFTNEDGFDNLKETIEANYKRIRQEILSLVDAETKRIKELPSPAHLAK